MGAITRRLAGPGRSSLDEQTGTQSRDPASRMAARRIDQTRASDCCGQTRSAGRQHVGTGTPQANVGQQDWFVAVATKVILPGSKRRIRLRDGLLVARPRRNTARSRRQSEQLTPGINGPTSKAAIRNADDNLAQIKEAIIDLGLEDTTDIVVTADHGFSTISKQSDTSSAAKATYNDVPPGLLPPGFVAIDLAKALDLPLIDPDQKHKRIGAGEHPRLGNGLLGPDPLDTKVVVAANGGSDLIYLRKPDRELARKVVDALLAQDYVSGIFLDEFLGQNSRHHASPRGQSAGQRSDADAHHRDQLQVIRDGLRRGGSLHRRGRRHSSAAGTRHARQF